MRARTIHRLIAAEGDAHGPLLIATGLALLIAAAWLPSLPVVTSMAILAAGATKVTLARFRGTAALWPVMMLHAAMYGALYALFIGATLHAAATLPEPGLGALAAADLTTSTFPMGVAVACIVRELRLGLGLKG